MRPDALVFDFDGVLADSVGVKTAAFERLFAPEGPAAVRRIREYHLANGGLSRYEKFRYAYREVLRRPLTPDAELALGKRFNALVEEAVSAAPEVPGARAFLEAHHRSLPIFVASGTPEDELRRILERRGMGRFFRAAYGSPRGKEAILLQIASDLDCAPSRLVMVGDALNDAEAARKARTAFIGVVLAGAENPFPPSVRALADLTGLARVLELERP